jgi:hypothetical protein
VVADGIDEAAVLVEQADNDGEGLAVADGAGADVAHLLYGRWQAGEVALGFVVKESPDLLDGHVLGPRHLAVLPLVVSPEIPPQNRAPYRCWEVPLDLDQKERPGSPTDPAAEPPQGDAGPAESGDEMEPEETVDIAEELVDVEDGGELLVPDPREQILVSRSS